MVDSLFEGTVHVAQTAADVPWAETAVGRPTDWAPALRLALRTLVRSPVPMLLWWGPELTQFHNDAFVPLLPSARPAMGVPAATAWSDCWDRFAARCEATMARGRASIHRARPRAVGPEAPRTLEDWDHACTPVFELDGSVAGLLLVAYSPRGHGGLCAADLWEIADGLSEPAWSADPRGHARAPEPAGRRVRRAGRASRAHRAVARDDAPRRS